MTIEPEPKLPPAPTYGPCPSCRLFTLLSYPDGRATCANYTCSLYKGERKR